MKRHSPRGDAAHPAPAMLSSEIPAVQLSFPFRPFRSIDDGQHPPSQAGVGSESRRSLRRAAAARQVRLAPTIEQETDRVATALALYLPPGKTLELRLTNNHYSMISVRRKADGYRLRLHRMFVGAEPRTVRALARYMVHNDRRAS
ncbi:MAG TPA: hypothetical protein VKQ32_01610, partial [Polyangia bacterium]|nr:hypothetical protein [Polyangia bacterium]